MVARSERMHGVEELCALLFYSPITFSCSPAPSWINVIFTLRGANQNEHYWTVPKVVIATFKCDRIQNYVLLLLFEGRRLSRKRGRQEINCILRSLKLIIQDIL